MCAETATKAAALVLALTSLSCQPRKSTEDVASSREPTPKAVAAPISTYKIARMRDVSFRTARATIHRLDVRVTVPDYYKQGQVLAIAKDIVASEVKKRAVNGISILFYGPNADPDGAFDIASVDWAPGGKWENASSVSAGDYRAFQYSIKYLPQTSPRHSTLRRSSKTGLFGTPLPEGAWLVKKFPGNPSEGRDPYEKYRIEASAAEIEGFYEHEMTREGWNKQGASTDNVLFYRKGKVMLGVIVNKEGQTFTLIGS